MQNSKVFFLQSPKMWTYKQAKSCRSFFVTLGSLCFQIFLVFVFYFIEVGEIFLNTEEIHEILNACLTLLLTG